MIRTIAIAIVVGLPLLVSSGCASQEGRTAGKEQGTAPTIATPPPAASSFYQEVEHEDRIFVIGKESTFKESKDTPIVPYRKTFVGAGPGGKTVIIEADQKDEALEKRLIGQFSEKHGVSLE